MKRLKMNENRKPYRGLVLGLIAAAVVGTLPMSVRANDVTEANSDADTTVSGTVSSEVRNPSYVISIPSSIDFGALKKPATNINAYKDIPFEIKMVSLSDLQEGQVVAVLVRDSSWATGPDEPTSRFSIVKTPQNLLYDVYTGSNSPEAAVNVHDNATWYQNGFLYGSFGVGSAGKNIPGALRLNQKQLFDKNLADYEGNYTGTLKFHTAIIEASNY